MIRSLRIRDLIEVPPVRTVVRLSDRREMSRELEASFVLTSDVDRHLTVLAEALAQDTGKGYFLQGDFGSGKSHFLAALAACLSSAPDETALAERHTALRTLRASGRRLLVADIALIDYRATTPLEKLVILGIEQALRNEGVDSALSPLAAFLSHLRGLCEDESIAHEFAALCKAEPDAVLPWIDEHPREAFVEGEKLIRKLGLPAPELLVEDRHETLERAMQTVKQAGFDGLVLLLDELSEFFRSKPDAKRLNEDARMLQFLGESASSSPLWIVAAVQESLERTGDIAQVTFRKIKDRFPVRLRLSTVHIRDLLGKRLIRHQPGAGEQIRCIFDMFREEFPSFTCSFEHFLSIYPVHPVTLGLLEGLGDLFSQHRGIVDFVHTQTAGAPERGVTGILDRPALELLAPDSIYEHFASRLAEFSDFNVFPRHIVPHLDEVIERTLEDDSDRQLCRRLIRILVLYHVHPTATAPTLRQLTELVGCVLAPGQPDLNLEFVGEALLDPITVQSPFLSRTTASTGQAGDTVYQVGTESTPDKTLRARIDSVEHELGTDDTRLLAAILPQIPETAAWPGQAVLGEGVTRTVTWRQSTRKALVRFCLEDDEEVTREAVTEAIRTTAADFGLVLCSAHVQFDANDLPAAVWRIPEPEDSDRALRRWFATRQVAEALKPSNPADAPLIEPAQEALRRLVPLAADEALRTVYRGVFVDADISVEPAALQLRRFDRILDAAALHLLEERYPRFAEIAPRGISPSPRLCQRVADELLMPGKLSLQDARQRGLTTAIEGIATPLGLVEVKAGAYLVAPDPASHPLLSFVMSLLRPAAPTPRAHVYAGLQSGPFGMPEDTVTFLLTALASAGLVTLLRGGRTLPLDFLRFVAVENCEEIAPGDLVSQQDRDLLMAECSFLAPPHGWDTFGLKQQREAWQSLVAFKRRSQSLLDDCRQRLSQIAEFSAFRDLDLHAQEEKLAALDVALAEIKTSYPARDGLERFLCGWRRSGLSQQDVAMLKRLHVFLQRDSESFIFLNHYLSHPAVEAAAGGDEGLAATRQALLAHLQDPDQLLTEEDGQRLNPEFDQFRTAYTAVYAAAHDAYWRAQAKPTLDRLGRRALGLLQRLRTIEALEQPPRLQETLDALEKPGREPCQRHVGEQLLRMPVCDCGFQFDRIEAAPGAAEAPDSLLDGFLQSYARTLSQPPVLELLEARAFALADASPAAAERLRHMARSLRDDKGQAPARLFEILDKAALSELEEALAGTVTVVHRDLTELGKALAGRRLRPAQVTEVMREWLGKTPEDALVAIDGGGALAPVSSAAPDPVAGVWAISHRDLFPNASEDTRPGNVRELESRLQAALPAAGLARRMATLQTDQLLSFIADETCHTDAVRQAWLVVAERFLDEARRTGAVPERSAHLDREKAEQITTRLRTLICLVRAAEPDLPERLSARIWFAALACDTWATDALIQGAARAIDVLARNAQDWLCSLPPVPVIDPQSAAAVVVIDAVTPDVWLTAAAGLDPGLLGEADVTWSRLQSKPDTIASLNALFGLQGDPSAALHAHGAAYHHVTGREAHGLRESIPEIPADRLSVIRVSCLDHDAHHGAIRLQEMPTQLADLCRHQILPFRDDCHRRGLPFILTTDHGLSLDRRRLCHGQGGVYEEAIFRVTWASH